MRYRDSLITSVSLLEPKPFPDTVGTENADNFIVTTGPNAPISNGSLVGAIEKELDFALAFVRKIQTQDLRYAVVSDEAAKEFDDWKNAQMSIMSWTGDCTSW